MPPRSFLCVGAQKCGTTWLARAVTQHPKVATGRRKELHFFDDRKNYARAAVRRNERLSHFEMRLRHASPPARWVMERMPERARALRRWTIPIPDADRGALAERYRPEVARLEELLGRRMPWPHD